MSLWGEWEYYQGELLSPSDLRERLSLPGAEAPDYLLAPSRWPPDDSGYPFGAATYRGVFIAEPGRTYALDIPNQDTAYALYLDGVLIAADGVAGPSPETSVPSRRMSRHYWTQADESFEIMLAVSNFHHYKGGYANPIKIGSPAAVNASRNRTLAFTFFFLGSFLVIGLFYLLNFVFRPSFSANLWFALLCFTFGIRSLFIESADISFFFPSIRWITITKGGFLLQDLMIPLFVLYVHTLFPAALPKAAVRASLAACALFTTIGLVVIPVTFYAKHLHDIATLALYGTALSLSLRMLHLRTRGHGNALWFGLSFLLMFFLALDPFVLTRYLGDFRYESATMGFLVFVLCQAYLLSRRLAADYKRLDLLTAELERRVEERTLALAEANASLKESSESKEFFLMSLSHEVRTPMTLILNYLERIGRKLPGDADLAIVKQSLSRILLDMVDIFDFLRSGRGKKLYASGSALDLRAELERLRALYLQSAEDAGLSLGLETEEGLAIEMHPQALARLCGNCIENSIKYAKRGGYILLTARAEGTRVILSVEDSGPAVPAEFAGIIFKPFRQATPESEGLGLGLYLVSEIARQAGGQASFEVIDGRNRFTFALPRIEGRIARTEMHTELSVPKPARLEPRREGAAEASKDLDEGLLLIVEDRKDIRDFYVSVLHPRFLVRTAKDGNEALRFLKAGLAPDLILSDVMMPGMDGFSLLRALDAYCDEEPSYPGKAIPMLFVTAMSSAPDQVPASAFRPVDVLVKPFSEAELVSRIMRTLEERPSASPEILPAERAV